jgi:SAM-dependent methyltransferase
VKSPRTPKTVAAKSKGQSYDGLYEEFDSPLMQRLRREAYGKDIGQHSWVTAEELEEDISQLRLSRTSLLLDLGCGPGGPLAFIVGRVGCRGTGVDVSAKAIDAGRARAASLNLGDLLTLQEANLNKQLPFTNSSFDAVISVDVVLHLRDRAGVFSEVARVLAPCGKFLFTDAAVITGSVSDEEVRLRAVHGLTQFVAPGFNERMLELAGFRLIVCKDRTPGLLKNATGRLAARLAHRAKLEKLEGKTYFERQLRYLETVIELSQRGAVSRMMYLAESLA